MNEIKTSCIEVMAHICDNLGEELNSPKCLEIKGHLQNCEHCRNYFTSIESTIEFYKKYNVTVSEEAHNRLLDCLGLDKL